MITINKIYAFTFVALFASLNASKAEMLLTRATEMRSNLEALRNTVDALVKFNEIKEHISQIKTLFDQINENPITKDCEDFSDSKEGIQKFCNEMREKFQHFEQKKSEFFIEAVLKNNIEEVEFFLDKAKVDPNTMGDITVASFIKKGATVIRSKINDRVPVLLMAVDRGHREIVDLLLKAKADPNKAQEHTGSLEGTKINALFIAMVREDVEMIRMLKEAGAIEQPLVGDWQYVSLVYNSLQKPAGAQ
jgi:DNA repair exonuclease SbcCD ATPase subunit